MPEPRKRSRSKKRQKINTPGGKRATHYKKKKKGDTICAICGRSLKGTEKESSTSSKSSKKPERPYGGYICHECLEKEITLEVIRRFPPGEDIKT